MHALETPRRGAGVAAALVRAWAVFGVLLLFAKGIAQLGIRGVLTMQAGLTPVQWLVLAGLTALFLYFEGYRGIQRRFAPVVVRRARELPVEGHASWSVLAPLYAMSLVGAPRRTLLRAWAGVTAIVIAVVIVRNMSEPWRGIVDAAVTAALLWGAVAIGVAASRRKASESGRRRI